MYVFPLNVPRASWTLSLEGEMHPVLEPSISSDFHEYVCAFTDRDIETRKKAKTNLFITISF
jgi:hypothetical protein